MPPTVVSRFGVLGSPIAHSRSPLLHRAAIGVLGIDAEYDSAEVTEPQLADFLESCDPSYLGFSLTMPLKQAVRGLLVAECDVSRTTGAVNTIVRRPDGWHGFNTDVWGATTAIAQAFGSRFGSATILGSGATAASMVMALNGVGVRDVTILARNVVHADHVARLATRHGMAVTVSELGRASTQSDILVNTLPASVELDAFVVEEIDAARLFDVVYDPWPTPLAREWVARGLPVTSGLSMLLWQAVRQARVFYGDDIDEELPNESVLITAMRSAVGL